MTNFPLDVEHATVGNIKLEIVEKYIKNQKEGRDVHHQPITHEIWKNEKALHWIEMAFNELEIGEKQGGTSLMRWMTN